MGLGSELNSVREFDGRTSAIVLWSVEWRRICHKLSPLNDLSLGLWVEMDNCWDCRLRILLFELCANWSECSWYRTWSLERGSNSISRSAGS